jgi:hypothetical protein
MKRCLPAIVALLLANCGGRATVVGLPVGGDLVVAASHRHWPAWTMSRRDSDEHLYFVGVASNVPSLAQAFDLAYLNALLQLTRSMGMAWTVVSRRRGPQASTRSSPKP